MLFTFLALFLLAASPATALKANNMPPSPDVVVPPSPAAQTCSGKLPPHGEPAYCPFSCDLAPSPNVRTLAASDTRCRSAAAEIERRSSSHAPSHLAAHARLQVTGVNLTGSGNVSFAFGSLGEGSEVDFATIQARDWIYPQLLPWLRQEGSPRLP
jgi:hypothetical protein